MPLNIAEPPRKGAGSASRRFSQFALLALCGLALSACVVYPAGPGYYPHAYFYGGGGYHYHGGWYR